VVKIVVVIVRKHFSLDLKLVHV